MAVEKWKRRVVRQWRYFCCVFFNQKKIKKSTVVVCGCDWWGKVELVVVGGSGGSG